MLTKAESKDTIETSPVVWPITLRMCKAISPGQVSGNHGQRILPC